MIGRSLAQGSLGLGFSFFSTRKITQTQRQTPTHQTHTAPKSPSAPPFAHSIPPSPLPPGTARSLPHSFCHPFTAGMPASSAVERRLHGPRCTLPFLLPTQLLGPIASLHPTHNLHRWMALAFRGKGNRTISCPKVRRPQRTGGQVCLHTLPWPK